MDIHLKYKNMTLSERFEIYHKENPHIYRQFVIYTIHAIESGYKNFGSQMIFEKIRWETGVVSKNSDFKINNDYAAFYSRLFMNDYPSYNGYFRVRQSYADIPIEN